MPEIIRPPWTPEQVKALNAYQHAGAFHPFTCVMRGELGHDVEGVLVATPSGWICEDCTYRQDWAHAFMAEGQPVTPADVMAFFGTGPGRA